MLVLIQHAPGLYDDCAYSFFPSYVSNQGLRAQGCGMGGGGWGEADGEWGMGGEGREVGGEGVWIESTCTACLVLPTCTACLVLP